MSANSQRSNSLLVGDLGARIKARAIANRNKVRDECVAVSRKIHRFSEPSGSEFKSRDCLIDAAVSLGCSVERGLGSQATGMRASIGDGSKHIGLFAEYDALPGIGHACGHNLVSGAALTALMLLVPVVQELEVKVSLLGTPCEESGAGKVELFEEGVFDGLNYALLAHPSPIGSDSPTMAALSRFKVRIESSMTGHSGAYCSGLAATEVWHFLTNALIALQKRFGQSVLLDWEAVTSSHSAAIRAKTLEADVIIRGWRDVVVVDAGKALISACTAVGEITGVQIMCQQSQKFMRAMRQDGELARLWAANRRVFGMSNRHFRFPAATDMGRISHRIPCLHAYFDIGSWPAKNHDPEFTDAADTDSAYTAMINAGSVLAMTVIDLGVGYGPTPETTIQHDFNGEVIHD